MILTESDAEEAMQVAERIRQNVKKEQLAGPNCDSDDPRNLVTVSVGVSVYAKGENLDEMLYRADQAMYRCKARGGDTVELVDWE